MSPPFLHLIERYFNLSEQNASLLIKEKTYHYMKRAQKHGALHKNIEN